MKYLALIDSPLQAMSLIEAMNRFKCPTEDLYIVFNANSAVASTNMELIFKVFDFYKVKLNPSQYKVIDVLSSFKEIVKKRRDIRQVLADYKNLKFDSIFVGEFRSYLSLHIANKLSTKKIVLLDDGNAIRRAPKLRSQFNFKAKLKAGLGFLWGMNFLPFKEVIYFSAFLEANELLNSKDKLINNDFTFLADIINRKSKTVTSIIAIVGSPLSEAGVCSIENECLLLNKLFNYVKVRHPDYQLVYIPHRRDKKKKLQFIKKFVDDIDDRLIPIEMKLLDAQPYLLYGFYSSCFETIPKIYCGLQINALVIGDDMLNDSWVEFVTLQYENYQKIHNINMFKASLD